MEYARVSRDIAQPVDRVWTIVRDFGGIAAWVAGVTDCALEPGRDGGPVRLVTLGGRQVREQLLAIDEAGRQLSYAILPPHSLPADHVRSTITVAPLGPTATRVTWFSEAELPAADPALTARIEGFFAASLAKLEQLC